MDFFGRSKGGERALLVQPHAAGKVDAEALTEFAELARSAGADILDTLTARIDAPNPRFYLGSGKVDQLRELKEAHAADLVLVMSVDPGFGGQPFIPSTYAKLDDLRGRPGGRVAEISVDGGVTVAEARPLAERGATVLVAGTAAFRGGAPAYAANIRALRGGG